MSVIIARGRPDRLKSLRSAPLAAAVVATRLNVDVPHIAVRFSPATTGA